jgi:hypothetical protein
MKLNYIYFLFFLILFFSCKQPEWKQKGFDSELSYKEFIKNNYFDSLDKALPNAFSANSLIGKYYCQYKILSIDINGIMKMEFPASGYSPKYYIIDLNNPELWNSLYGHGLRIKTNFRYNEENDTYSFEYHTNDDFAYPVVGYVYYSDGSRTNPNDGDGYIAQIDLFNYFVKKGFRIK